MKVRYDPEADAAYIEMSTAAVVESEEIHPGVVLDFGADNRIVGIEVLGARKKLDPRLLETAARPPAAAPAE